MTDKYILEGRTPKACEDLLLWAVWIQNTDRTVAKDKHNGIRVSTVFLGLDHSYDEEGPPILFETMVCGGIYDNDMARYSTWEEALRGHHEMCKKAFELQGGDIG